MAAAFVNTTHDLAPAGGRVFGIARLQLEIYDFALHFDARQVGVPAAPAAPLALSVFARAQCTPLTAAPVACEDGDQGRKQSQKFHTAAEIATVRRIRWTHIHVADNLGRRIGVLSVQSLQSGNELSETGLNVVRREARLSMPRRHGDAPPVGAQARQSNLSKCSSSWLPSVQPVAALSPDAPHQQPNFARALIGNRDVDPPLFDI